ncbi:hypothetical protein QCA50_011753 [Cerrena zonata]|uniref:Ribosomal protein S14 n=1 Tax=Cerrena zonata TaxID=2478898 RepID=A0AAW0G0N3_9APHY
MSKRGSIKRTAEHTYRQRCVSVDQDFILCSRVGTEVSNKRNPAIYTRLGMKPSMETMLLGVVSVVRVRG